MKCSLQFGTSSCDLFLRMLLGHHYLLILCWHCMPHCLRSKCVDLSTFKASNMEDMHGLAPTSGNVFEVGVGGGCIRLVITLTRRMGSAWHETGQSLLLMITSKDAGFQELSSHIRSVVPIDPFLEIRERLRAMGNAFESFSIQVNKNLCIFKVLFI